MDDERWDNTWIDELKIDDPKSYDRLCICKNTRNDLKKYAKLIYAYNRQRTKEECLDRAIIWLTDWNNQVSLIPDDAEYKKILEFM